MKIWARCGLLDIVESPLTPKRYVAIQSILLSRRVDAGHLILCDDTLWDEVEVITLGNTTQGNTTLIISLHSIQISYDKK